MNEFCPQSLNLIWGDHPLCVHTLKNSFAEPIDFHHILGRGNKRPDRNIFRSVLNAVPLCRSIHQGPLRDHRLQRMTYLDIVYDRVRNSPYRLEKVDYDFLEFANKWVESLNIDGKIQ